MSDMIEKIKKIGYCHNYQLERFDLVDWINQMNEVVRIALEESAKEPRINYGHYGCNSNGEHEKCKNCGIYNTCSNKNSKWFGETDQSECVWEKLSDNDVYRPSCVNHNSRSDARGFKYCPYCGRKLVVEHE